MTLSFRNKAFIFTIGLAGFVFILLCTTTFLGYYSKHFSANISTLRLLPFFSSQYAAVLASIISLIAYVIITGLIVYFLFQKTQSAEIIYFNIFLLSCLFESLRFFILYTNTSGIYSSLVLPMARAVFFGQTCAPITFLIAAIFLGKKQDESIERFCSLIFAAGIICSFFIPFNTGVLTSNAMLTYGFMAQINGVRILFACIAFFSFLINSSVNETPELKPAALGYLLLYFGYIILTITDNFPLFFFGFALLGGGTTLFVRSLHRYYLWK